MDDWELQILREAYDDANRHDPVRQRVRFVFFPTSGHEVVIVDNRVMFQVRRGEIRSRKKRDGYSHPDALAEEILIDIPFDRRTPDLLLERAIRNACSPM